MKISQEKKSSFKKMGKTTMNHFMAIGQLLYTRQVCDILVIDGKRLDPRTFLKVAKDINLKPEQWLPPYDGKGRGKVPLWDKDKIIALKRSLKRSKQFGYPVVVK